MAAIYNKALKRKDFSGVVKKKEANDKNDPKAGADVGKVVNLMASDANLVGFPIPRSCLW
jgi:hypothetical protein